MCLGIPGKITEITKQGSLRMGKVDFGGVSKQTCLDFVPEARLGDYVLIHVGFAISVLSEEEAQDRLSAVREVAEFARDLGLEDATPRPPG
jgi:hydrogenase expression/formation protein HypC